MSRNTVLHILKAQKTTSKNGKKFVQWSTGQAVVDKQSLKVCEETEVHQRSLLTAVCVCCLLYTSDAADE